MSFSPTNTVWPADSVEFCPHEDATNILICGTYNLEKPEPDTTNEPTEEETAPVKREAQRRRGQCLVYNLDQSHEKWIIKNSQELEFPAIPDVKWCHRNRSARPALAVADSEGGVTLLEYEIDEASLRVVQSLGCADTDVLCLSLDWSTWRADSTNLGDLVVSMSNGSIALLRPSHGEGLRLHSKWRAHDFEPWIAAWNYWDTNIIYTGGDDLKMKGWDIRQATSQPIFTNKRFDAGVTSIQSHPYVEHLVAVGSYDSTMRLFDVRKPLVPLCETDVGGGAWRVKWHPSPARKQDILVACMHDGCKVLHFEQSFDDISSASAPGTLLGRFDEHQSMAYGTDWHWDVHGREGNEETSLIASCSFYDHVLHFWNG